jgi:hypothetical protein
MANDQGRYMTQPGAVLIDATPGYSLLKWAIKTQLYKF